MNLKKRFLKKINGRTAPSTGTLEVSHLAFFSPTTFFAYSASLPCCLNGLLFLTKSGTIVTSVPLITPHPSHTFLQCCVAHNFPYRTHCQHGVLNAFTVG